MRTVILVALLAPSVASAECPPVITTAAAKAVPDASVVSCKPEREDGLDKFEVKLARKDRSVVEVDVAQDASVMAIEERITVDKLPAVVAKAFAAKYPKGKPTTAERQTVTGKGLFFEIAFGKNREATFKEDGTFVEEE